MGRSEVVMRRVALFLALFCSVQVIGQQDLPLTRQAARECRSGNLSEALSTIQDAIEGAEGDDAFSWYVKGYIHKQIFVDEEKENPSSPHRDQAIQAIDKSIALDKAGEYSDNCQKAMRFLAVTFYNDAIWGTRSFDPQHPEVPEASFKRFTDVMAKAEPGYDFTKNTIDFYKQMGTAFIRHFKIEDGKDRDLMESSNRYYKMVLALDSADYDSNYNLAINYYNLGVQRIKQINHGTDIFELLGIQDECVILFQQSLPYMLKAQRQDPNRVETLKGLMAIYRALSDHEKSTYYQRELQKLEQQE